MACNIEHKPQRQAGDINACFTEFSSWHLGEFGFLRFLLSIRVSNGWFVGVGQSLV